jgi:hypothetical protein
MHKVFNSKQELREEFERVTDPERPLPEQFGTIMSSAFIGGLLGVRNSLSLLKSYTTDNDDFPSEQHKLITHRAMSGMSERMTAFELELLNAMVDVAWEINNCECKHCIKTAAEADVNDQASKAKYN